MVEWRCQKRMVTIHCKCLHKCLKILRTFFSFSLLYIGSRFGEICMRLYFFVCICINIPKICVLIYICVCFWISSLKFDSHFSETFFPCPFIIFAIAHRSYLLFLKENHREIWRGTGTGIGWHLLHFITSQHLHAAAGVCHWSSRWSLLIVYQLFCPCRTRGAYVSFVNFTQGLLGRIDLAQGSLVRLGNCLTVASHLCFQCHFLFEELCLAPTTCKSSNQQPLRGPALVPPHCHLQIHVRWELAILAAAMACIVFDLPGAGFHVRYTTKPMNAWSVTHSSSLPSYLMRVLNHFIGNAPQSKI